jgi:lipopolysaccharide export system permease protein
MRILDHYIRSSVIWATGLVVLVLVGIESFIDFISELPSIGVADYGILSVFKYVCLQIPAELYQLFPVAGFLGGLIGLGRLASTSELIVMRAAGVSIARIAWAVVKAALLMLVIITAVGEWQAPTWQYQALRYKEKQTHRNLNPWSSQDLWLHQGLSFVHIGAILSSTTIQDIERFDFDKNNHLLSSSTAVRGVLQNDGSWQLEQVNKTDLGPSESLVKHYDRQPLGFNFEPDLLRKKMQRDPEQQTISVLWNNIRYRRQAGLLANELESAFWARVLQPLTTVVMICLGVPFIFGSLRSASMSGRILTGIIVGFAFYMLNQFLGPIALVYQWPAWIAAALPMLFFLLVYAVLLSRIK